jgi:hypothetical protein
MGTLCKKLYEIKPDPNIKDIGADIRQINLIGEYALRNNVLKRRIMEEMPLVSRLKPTPRGTIIRFDKSEDPAKTIQELNELIGYNPRVHGPRKLSRPIVKGLIAGSVVGSLGTFDLLNDYLAIGAGLVAAILPPCATILNACGDYAILHDHAQYLDGTIERLEFDDAVKEYRAKLAT